MKVFYTKEELLQLTPEEVLDIISITSLDGRIIFLDDVVIIESEFLIMKQGMDNIAITGPGSLQTITDKMMRFKTLKLLGTIDDLKEKNLLDEMIKVRLDTIDINVNSHLANVIHNSNENFIKSNDHIVRGMQDITKNINKQLVALSDDLTAQVMASVNPEMLKMQEFAAGLATTIEIMSKDIRRINYTKLTNVTDSLEKITKLLSEVIED